MGSNADIMHKFANKELKSLYPSIDGWTVRKADDLGGNLEGFLATRKVYGQQEAVNVIVSFDRVVSQALQAYSLLATSADKGAVRDITRLGLC